MKRHALIVLMLVLVPQLGLAQAVPHTLYWAPNRVGTYIQNTGWFNMWHRQYGLRWPAEGDNFLVSADARFVFVGRKQGQIVTAVSDMRRVAGWLFGL